MQSAFDISLYSPVSSDRNSVISVNQELDPYNQFSNGQLSGNYVSVSTYRNQAFLF